MEIRIRDTGAVVTESEFRAMHPNTSFPLMLTTATLDAYNSDIVFEGPQAQPGRYQVAFRDGVEEIDGKWFTKWSVTDMSAEAIAAKDTEQAKSVRTTRNKLLADTDWTQLVDAPLTQEQSFQWQTYRQALRDLSLQAGFPWEVTWPSEP